MSPAWTEEHQTSTHSNQKADKLLHFVADAALTGYVASFLDIMSCKRTLGMLFLFKK